MAEFENGGPCKKARVDTNMDIAECFDVMVGIAREAGEVVRKALDSDITIEDKGCSTDLVTETDKKVEEMIISRLRDKYPHTSFIAEESVVVGQQCELTDNPTFIIDPIDGTTNFVHGFPYIAVCIALYINKTAEIGIVYQPIFDKMFMARRGGGAFCNKKKLKVSGQKDLRKALIVAEHPQIRDPVEIEASQKNLESLIKAPVHGIRTLGSVASDLCAVAEGVVDADFAYGLHCWDMAGAVLIIQEAGGVVIDPEGGPLDLMSRRILTAGTQELADVISQKLTHLQLPRD
ncbi:inositol monophosphatase 1-like [Glandiceps talaboti]